MQKWPYSALVVCPILLLISSCATKPHSSSTQLANKLPADVKMNRDAGRGNLIFVPIRLENGEELPFILDTGASATCFDASLEPQLGTRLDTDTSFHFGIKGEAVHYLAPKLYLGSSLLQMTGTNIAAIDLKDIGLEVGCPVMSVLGIDVLEHYCIQLDFKANRIHFLDSEHADKRNWGKPFPLTDLDACPVISNNLVGGKSPGSLIDTGCNSGGCLLAPLFDEWTHRAAISSDHQVCSPNGVLDGELYPDVDLGRIDQKLIASGDTHMKFNIIGLQLLARHLVTFDFPNHTMYLNRIAKGPLLKVKGEGAEGRSAYRYIKRLHQKGELLGWPREDKLTRTAWFHFYTLESGMLDFSNEWDGFIYHYRLVRASEASPWKLQKAWRTDKEGNNSEEYPLPGHL